MQKKAILILALIIAIMPFLGIPDSWKAILFIIVALSLIFAAYKEDIFAFFTLPDNGRGTMDGGTYVESAGGIEAPVEVGR